MARVEHAVEQTVVILVMVVVRALTSCLFRRVQVLTECLFELLLDELAFLVGHSGTGLEACTDLLLHLVKFHVAQLHCLLEGGWLLLGWHLGLLFDL